MWSLMCLNGNCTCHLAILYISYVYICFSQNNTQREKTSWSHDTKLRILVQAHFTMSKTQTTDPVPKHKQLAMTSWINDTLTGARAFYSLFIFCTLILQCGGYFSSFTRRQMPRTSCKRFQSKSKCPFLDCIMSGTVVQFFTRDLMTFFVLFCSPGYSFWMCELRWC